MTPEQFGVISHISHRLTKSVMLQANPFISTPLDMVPIYTLDAARQPLRALQLQGRVKRREKTSG